MSSDERQEVDLLKGISKVEQAISKREKQLGKSIETSTVNDFEKTRQQGLRSIIDGLLEKKKQLEEQLVFKEGEHEEETVAPKETSGREENMRAHQ